MLLIPLQVLVPEALIGQLVELVEHWVIKDTSKHEEVGEVGPLLEVSVDILQGGLEDVDHHNCSLRFVSAVAVVTGTMAPNNHAGAGTPKKFKGSQEVRTLGIHDPVGKGRASVTPSKEAVAYNSITESLFAMIASSDAARS